MITNSDGTDSGESLRSEFVRVRKDLPSGTVIIDHPERKNALSRIAIRQLQSAFSDFHQERQVRAVILTGSGDTFCSGTDLKELAETASQDDAQTQWHEAAEDYLELIEAMLRFPKPIIAAVNGPALGFGAGLVMASDIVIGGTDAAIGWPEARRGLVASISAPLLAFRVGAGIASRLLLTGDVIDCDEALQYHLIHESVDNDLVWARAMEIAEQCAECAPTSIQLTKQMLNETIGEAIFSQHATGAAHSAAARTTDTAGEGVNSFLDHRAPDWDAPTGWELD